MLQAGDLLQAIMAADAQINSTWQVMVLAPVAVLGVVASSYELDRLTVLARLVILAGVGAFLYVSAKDLVDQYDRMAVLQAAFGELQKANELSVLRELVIKQTPETIKSAIFFVGGMFMVVFILLFVNQGYLMSLAPLAPRRPKRD